MLYFTHTTHTDMSTTHTFVVNRLTSKVILRKEAMNAAGKCPLCMQIFVNGRRLVLPLSIMLSPDNWDQPRERIQFAPSSTLSKIQVSQLNDIVVRASDRVNDIRHFFEMTDQFITAEAFREEFTNENRKNDFFDFSVKELRRLETDGARESSTIRSQMATVNTLRRFRAQLRFGELTFEFVQAFDGWLRRQVSLNTVSKHHKTLKMLINLAIKRGIRITNPYKGFRVKRITGNRFSLSDDEVKALQSLYSSKVLQHGYQSILRAFLFSCFTGLRISDISALTWDDIAEKELRFIPQKTKNVNPMLLVVPLNASALTYLPDRGHRTRVFESFTTQYINRTVKELMKLIGADPSATFHVARHTFASGFLRAGGQVEVLQKILGHRKIETTMVYVHVDSSTMHEQMAQMK